MAMATAVLSPPSFAGATMNCGDKAQKRMKKVEYARGLNSFEGLKVHDSVITLTLPMATDKCFAKIVKSFKLSASNGKVKRGGALSSTCNAAGEIFQIAAVMNGLVLVGVAFDSFFYELKHGW